MRIAIATGDRKSALKLLRAHVEGGLDLSGMSVTVGDALVETARGARQSALNDASGASVPLAGEARAQIVELLIGASLSTVDLAEIRNVLDAVDARALDEEERVRREESRDDSASDPP